MGYVGPHVLQKKTPCRSVTSSRALLGLCCLVLGQSCHVMQLPLTAQNSAIKRCPQCRRPCIIWQHVTFCSRYTFLMVSNPDRIAPGRRLPESTQSTLHHYFIRSHADINAYLLIIDKFLLIRYQATVKQSTLFFADGS